MLDIVGKEISPENYNIDFVSAVLKFKSKKQPDFIKVCHTPYPDFLTKKYGLQPTIVSISGENDTSSSLIYQPTKNLKKHKPFAGIDSQSEITRRFTVGNNQNGVLNATLNLQLSGKLSEKITLNASVINTDLPIQENGNTFEVNDFNRVFIELRSEDDWSINAVDVFLKNTDTKFLRFNKRVVGLDVHANFGDDKSKWSTQASGAIVRGKYNRVSFTGIEGNQGPYQLSNFQDQYIRILEGTEQVFLNGKLLNRGREHDYLIDYNTSEVTFSPSVQVTADMRMVAEYQYFNQDYNRFSSYNKVAYSNDKLAIESYFFYETDLKESSIQQDLNDDDKMILANAGDNASLMIAPSFTQAQGNEEGVFYELKMASGITFFEHSTNEEAQLYKVNFSFVGENLGAYKVKEIVGNGTIYEFVGEGVGAYEPSTKLTSPSKRQLAAIKTTYQPNNTTSFNSELAVSNYDFNLFSSLNDEDNQGIAAKLGLQKVLYDQLDAKLTVDFNYEFIDKDFETIERIQSIEFQRDWNIPNITGNQQLFQQKVDFSSKKSDLQYQFDRLELNDEFKANKHELASKLHLKNLKTLLNLSYLTNDYSLEEGTFLRGLLTSDYEYKKSWLGISLAFEENEVVIKETQLLLPSNHRFLDVGTRFGLGDSTKVFAEVGVHVRATDSVKNNQLTRVNNAQNFYVKSRYSKGNQNLTANINYRRVYRFDLENQTTLNSTIVLSNQFFKKLISLNTSYQTISGNLPQQDFRYVKTAEGQAFYTWNDYNNDGIQDLNEFEIAQFIDEANYLRVLLPTINYLPTHKNIFSQELLIRPQKLKQQKGWGSRLSKLQGNVSVNIENNREKTSNGFNLNPFDLMGNDLLGLNYRLGNTLKYQGKKLKAVYSYHQAAIRNISTIDTLASESYVHKFLIKRKLSQQIHTELLSSMANNSNASFVFSDRNYLIKSSQLRPSLTVKHSDRSSLSFFYDFERKKNEMAGLESLSKHTLGLNYSLTTKKNSEFSGSLNYVQNDYDGLLNSPTAYQLLEGLQAGRNFTWNAVLVKKVNSFLNLDVSYFGRASSTSSTVHTGSLQLRAVF